MSQKSTWSRMRKRMSVHQHQHIPDKTSDVNWQSNFETLTKHSQNVQSETLEQRSNACASIILKKEGSVKSITNSEITRHLHYKKTRTYNGIEMKIWKR